MQKMFIEVRANEYVMRDVNKHVPWTADELADDAARCRDAGATIYHYHARMADGSPDNSLEANQEIIRKIRAKTDILVHPTLGFISNDLNPKDRIDRSVSLCNDPATRPDILPIDMGSFNFELYDAATKTMSFPERVYHNTTETILYAAEQFTSREVAVQIVCWDLGFARRAAAVLDMGVLKEPAFFMICLMGGNLITGPQVTPLALDAMLEALPLNKRGCFCVLMAGTSMMSMVPYIAKSGGHLSVGLGDHGYPEFGCPDNAGIVLKAAEMAKQCGRELADVAETRAMIGGRQ